MDMGFIACKEVVCAIYNEGKMDIEECKNVDLEELKKFFILFRQTLASGF